MKQRTILNLSLVLSLGASAIGCGSDDGKDGTHNEGSGGAGTGGSSTTGGASHDAHHEAGGSSASTGGGGAMGGAITLDSVAPLGNAMHVMWTNSGADCDKIELWRNKDGGMYALAYTLAATADSQHDAQANTPGKYCYKVHCVKGSDDTESNEKCASL